MNNSNTKTYLLLLTFFIFSCGSDSANNATDSAQIEIADETQEEILTNSINESKKDKDEQSTKNKANIDEFSKSFLKEHFRFYQIMKSNVYQKFQPQNLLRVWKKA